MIPHSSAVCSSRWESYHRKSYQKTSVIFPLSLQPSDEGRRSMPSTLRAKPRLNFSCGLCCQLKVRVASLGKSWEMIRQLPQLNYVTLAVLLLPQPPPLVNSNMISPESCFAGCPRPYTLPMGCCPGDSANAKAFVCLDFKPLSREKNKGSCSNQAPSQEQLSHSDYCYLPGTQEALSE